MSQSISAVYPRRSTYHVVRSCAALNLSWHERAALGLGIFEIPIQLDKYFMFHQHDAELGAVGGFNVSITSICLAYLYAVWFAGCAVHRQNRQQKFLFGIPQIFYLATVAISIFAASVPLLAMFDLFLLMQAYAMFFYLANRLKTYEDLVFSILMLAATMTMQSLLIFGLASLGSGAAGQDYRFGPVLLSVWPDGRIAGSLHSAVVAGSLLAILWLPVMALNLSVRSRRTWVLSAGAMAAGILALLLTQTRGAVLTVGIGIIVIGLGMHLRGWLPKWAIIFALILAIVGAVPLAYIVQKRVMGDDEGSAESRKHLSLIAMETISHRPLFGYGAGNCHIACEPVANSGMFRSEWYYTIHCKYLLVWVETGVFGLLAFLLVLGNGLRQGLSAWAARDRLLSPLGLACAAAIAGHMVHMFVDIFNSRPQVETLWTVLGITAAIHQHSCLKPLNREMRMEGASYVT